MSNILSSELIGKRESVVDEFLLLNPYQTPKTSLFGFGKPVTNVEHVWFEDSYLAMTGKAASAATDVDTTITVDSVEAFRPEQIVKAGDELIRVISVNEGAKTLTVSRGYGGTTPAAIAQGDTIEVLFVEGVEGRVARDGRYKARVRKSNMTQIFDDSIEISGTAAAIAQHGVANEYEKERQKVQIQLALQLEKAIVDGLFLDNGDKRMMRGMRSFIETNVVSAGGAALTEDMINVAFQKVYEAGGFDTGADYKIIVPAKQKLAISKFGADTIRLERGDNGRGQVVDHFVSDFGRAEIVLDNNLKPDELYVVDANRVEIRPLQGREFGHTYLGVQGDFTKGMVVGEYTLEFLQEQAHARIKGLA